MLFSKPDSASATPPTANMELSSNISDEQEQRQSNQCHDYSDMEVDSPEHNIQGISSSSNSPLPSNQANSQSLNALPNTSDGATEGTPTTNVQQLDARISDNEEEDEEDPYSIRLTPFIDHSSTTPALYISAVERKAHNDTVIRVGRYTERKETPAPKPEHAPIVFKSKVVSRSHAQLTVQDGQWFIQDVKSSSGTFLNHVRLSPASQQSPPYALKDGDILQLGMDFRGGSEEIYKCIKVRVEVNKSWQKRVNNFNINALSNLVNITSPDKKDLQECAICLLSVSPCQALFIAPCTHAWHYKCIRPLVIKSYPHFLCPNCRAMCDLEAEIETPDLSHLQDNVEQDA